MISRHNDLIFLIYFVIIYVERSDLMFSHRYNSQHHHHNLNSIFDQIVQALLYILTNFPFIRYKYHQRCIRFLLHFERQAQYAQIPTGPHRHRPNPAIRDCHNRTHSPRPPNRMQIHLLPFSWQIHIHLGRWRHQMSHSDLRRFYIVSSASVISISTPT